MFGILKKAAGAAFSAGSTEVKAKYQGNTDYLQAVCAAAALIAAADGDIEDSEIDQAKEIIATNDTLSSIYKKDEIEKMLDGYLRKAKTNYGKQALERELADVKNDHSKAMDVFAMAVDVSQADGDMEPQEVAALKKVAKILAVNPSDFGVN